MNVLYGADEIRSLMARRGSGFRAERCRACVGGSYGFHRAPGAEGRGLHLVGFGVGAVVAAAAFRNPEASGLVTEGARPAPVSLQSVALIGAPIPPAAAEPEAWPLTEGAKPLVARLGPGRPEGKVLPGYRGDWGDLIAAMMPAGCALRDMHGRATGPETLAALALDRGVLNAIMRAATGRRLGVWGSF